MPCCRRSSRRHPGGAILIASGSGRDGFVSDRIAADLERELAMLVSVRDRLRASEMPAVPGVGGRPSRCRSREGGRS
ncbi:hypothetical protein CJ177_43575 [Rhodococcus sp. ACPA1]|nr:hypothetical protein CJ177_43575 [Rhodococcus sp. ACPA1]